jgi:adenylate cyclase, class 2
MHGAEIELKFPVSDPQAFRRKVEALGFRLETERTFERNTLYDTADRSLRARGQIVRLRSYGNRCTITHKRLPEGNDINSRYKTRIETESGVDDCEALAEIFFQLGYSPVFRYDKFRTEWVSLETGGHLVVDETPIGVWAELEGEPAWIDTMLEQLGVAVGDTTTESYGRLFLNWKAETGSDAEHMTFESARVPQAVTA